MKLKKQNTRRTLLLCCFVAGLSLNAWARGMILSNNPIPGIDVVVLKQPHGNAIKGVTGDNGAFTIKLEAGSYLISLNRKNLLGAGQKLVMQTDIHSSYRFNGDGTQLILSEGNGITMQAKATEGFENLVLITVSKPTTLSGTVLWDNAVMNQPPPKTKNYVGHVALLSYNPATQGLQELKSMGENNNGEAPKQAYIGNKPFFEKDTPSYYIGNKPIFEKDSPWLKKPVTDLTPKKSAFSFELYNYFISESKAFDLDKGNNPVAFLKNSFAPTIAYDYFLVDKQKFGFSIGISQSVYINTINNAKLDEFAQSKTPTPSYTLTWQGSSPKIQFGTSIDTKFWIPAGKGSAFYIEPQGGIKYGGSKGLTIERDTLSYKTVYYTYASKSILPIYQIKAAYIIKVGKIGLGINAGYGNTGATVGLIIRQMPPPKYLR